MPNEIDQILSNLKNPLLFASKNNFKNLSKIKNLEDNINSNCTKILSLNPPEKIVELVNKIKSISSGLDDSDPESKINKIESILNVLDINSGIDTEVDSYNLANESSPISGNIHTADIRYIKGIGPKLSLLLNKKSIYSIEDLIFFSPRRYDDRRNISKIADIKLEEVTTVRGEILLANEVKNKKLRFFQVVISDNSSRLKLIWFNYKSSFLKSFFKKGLNIIVRGKITYNSYDKSLQIVHPVYEDIEIIDDTNNAEESLQFNRIVPIYSLTEGLTQKKLRKIIHSLIEQYSDLYTDLLSKEILNKYSLLPLNKAIKEVHFPPDKSKLVDLESGESVYNSLAHRAVIFFEFFLLELGLAYKKIGLEKNLGISFNPDSKLLKKLIKKLPFNLTKAQSRVISEIANDMNDKYPMNRLVQGDVGSGKTVVALASILTAIDSGYQAVLMVPTEILAEQHFSNIKKLTSDLNINVDILKSALSTKNKKEVYKRIQDGTSDLIIGTHALIQEGVDFKKLGLVVIDEQHRFGVLQRAKLISKGLNPDVLIMTATPIPRTLAITVYGDLDVSVIDELPPNRKEINTISIKDTQKNRNKFYELVRGELQSGRQVYFVYPFIEESENPDFKDIRYATKMAEELQNSVFTDYRVAILHGKMSTEEKEEVMQKFLENYYQILVSTTVIEVGVDVPNATVMVIENAERFGLSQLHQLRGRIGRGEHKSTCILVSSYKVGEDSIRRLNILSETNDGFKISEADLEIRGPGDFMGTKQSGIPTFKFANLIRDSKILEEARSAAFELINTADFDTDNKKLMEYVLIKWGKMLELNSVS